MEKEKSWGGKRLVSGRLDKEATKIENEKDLFMLGISEREREISLSIPMMCQERGCNGYTKVGIMHRASRGDWSIRPICKDHIRQYLADEIQIEIALDLESWEAFKTACDLERGGLSTEEEYQSAAKSLCRQAIDGFIKAHRDRGQCDPAIII
jgi:hypothetical protein